jgi:TetR/AcrR family tetracycline transcriptional repressor
MLNCGFAPVLALHTITALTNYVTGFVLREQTERPIDPGMSPAARLAALAQLLEGGVSAPLLVAIRDGGSPLGEQAFEHGLTALIDGTAVALAGVA